MSTDKNEDSKRGSILILKGSKAYADWFRRLVEFARMPGAVVMDRALTDWAKRFGFGEPPPKR